MWSKFKMVLGESTAKQSETHPQFLKQVKNAEKEMQDKLLYLERWRDCHKKSCEIIAVAETKGCADDYEVTKDLLV
jgi:hypothetical protein